MLCEFYLGEGGEREKTLRVKNNKKGENNVFSKVRNQICEW